MAPVLVMRSEPARSHSVSLPTARTPVRNAAASACPSANSQTYQVGSKNLSWDMLVPLRGMRPIL